MAAVIHFTDEPPIDARGLIPDAMECDNYCGSKYRFVSVACGLFSCYGGKPSHFEASFGIELFIQRVPLTWEAKECYAWEVALLKATFDVDTPGEYDIMTDIVEPWRWSATVPRISVGRDQLSNEFAWKASSPTWYRVGHTTLKHISVRILRAGSSSDPGPKQKKGAAAPTILLFAFRRTPPMSWLWRCPEQRDNAALQEGEESRRMLAGLKLIEMQRPPPPPPPPDQPTELKPAETQCSPDAC